MMKRICVFAAGLLLWACAGAQTQDAQREAAVSYLSTAAFKEKVHDYNANPDTWKYRGNKPCLVDFYADWCRPCKMLSPIIEELAEEYRGQILVYKVNVDNERELSAVFGIQSIPSLLFVPQEGTPAMQAGLMSKEQLKGIIDQFLLGKDK